MKYQFKADGLSIRMYKTDKSFSLSLDVGEYERNNLPFLMQGDCDITCVLYINEEPPKNGILSGVGEEIGEEMGGYTKPDQESQTSDLNWKHWFALQAEWCIAKNKTEEDYKQLLIKRGIIKQSRSELAGSGVIAKLINELEADLHHSQ